MPTVKPINPKHTLAILIGVSEFEDAAFANAPPIKNNVERLATLLQDEKILGLPQEQMLILDENPRHDEVLERMEAFLAGKKEMRIDTLVFYFAGHGYRKKEKGGSVFYLVAKNSRKRRMHVTGVPWEDIRDILERGGHGISQRLYILDACHAGDADLGAGELDWEEIAEGSALLAAAEWDEKAYFNSKETYTYFTGALIDVLEKGEGKKDVPGLTVPALYEQLDADLKSRGFKITQKATGRANSVAFFKNKAYDPLSPKRKKVAGLIKEGDVFFKALDFEKAEHRYLKAEKQAKPPAEFKTQLKTIQSKIQKCEEIQGYRKVFEQHFAKQIEELEKQLQGSQKQMSSLQTELEQKEKDVKAAEKDLVSKDKQIKSLQARVEKAETALAEAQARLAQLQEEKKKADEKVKTLQQELKALKKPSESESAPGRDYAEQVGDISFDMVFVQEGQFTMGCTKEQGRDCYNNEKPPHEVSLSDYYIGKYPVTQALWKAVMGNNPSRFNDCDDCPVENVSWDEVQEFIQKLNRLTGKKYRLPTEAEWEYAARGGRKSKGYKYAGSNKVDEVAWYDDHSGGRTQPVGGKKHNELGLYDMSGNVYEWCSDWYDENYYERCEQQGVVHDPQGPGGGSYRVFRGGSWGHSARRCRVSNRSSWNPGGRNRYLGFRVARSSKKASKG